MSCKFCGKKFGILGRKKAGPDGKCWSCQKPACSKCAPMYDGSVLGWVAPHPCCSGCSEALDRQKTKISKNSVLIRVTQKEREAANNNNVVSSLPEWTLPASTTSAKSSGASQSMATATEASLKNDRDQPDRPAPPPPTLVAPKAEEAASAAPPKSAVPERLFSPGARREETKRASRVLLQAVLENYNDRGSYGTPVRGRKIADNESSDEVDDEDDSATSDLDTPVMQDDPPAKQSPAEVKTPMGKLQAQENVEQKKRLSMGVLASLDDLSKLQQQMSKSFTAPSRADDEFVAALASSSDVGVPQVSVTLADETPKKEAPMSPDAVNSSFDAELMRELDALDNLTKGNDDLQNMRINISSIPLGHVETPEFKKQQKKLEEDINFDDVPVFEAELGEEVTHQEHVDEYVMPELGEEYHNPDAELLNQIESLDKVLPEDVQKKLVDDPLSGLGDALTSIASAGDNPDAQVAMHEDLLEVLGEVRREERDARMVAMLDTVEQRLKSSLVKAQTPKLKRKVEHANNLFHVGEIVSAKNLADGCWYQGKVVDTEADEKMYSVQFLTVAGKRQVTRESDLRKFCIGTSVLALYKADGLGLYQSAIIDHITPQGDYRVRFAGDSSVAIVKPDEVRKEAVQVALPKPQSAAVVAPVKQEAAPVTRAANPSALTEKEAAVRSLQFIQQWVSDQRKATAACSLDLSEDRRTLLISAQLIKYLRRMFETPASQLEPFEMRMPDSLRGENALYERLKTSTEAASEFLMVKFKELQTLIGHPKAQGEKLHQVCVKVARMRDWIRGVNDHIKNL